ncbi:hypothetical protein T492DRAFT_94392 [Pavlovales sp. CCMP2436]|nr:hypothetical protein T492DRAFT_94392 [Pavlovales sp. CCMP2436]
MNAMLAFQTNQAASQHLRSPAHLKNVIGRLAHLLVTFAVKIGAVDSDQSGSLRGWARPEEKDLYFGKGAGGSADYERRRAKRPCVLEGLKPGTQAKAASALRVFFNLIGLVGKYVAGSNASGNPFSSEVVSQVLLSRKKQAAACANLESTTLTTHDYHFWYLKAVKHSAGGVGLHPGYGERVENTAMHAQYAEYAVKSSIQAMFVLFCVAMPWFGLRNLKIAQLKRCQLKFHELGTPREFVEIIQFRSKTRQEGNLKEIQMSHSGCGRNCPAASSFECLSAQDRGVCPVCILKEASARVLLPCTSLLVTPANGRCNPPPPPTHLHAHTPPRLD